MSVWLKANKQGFFTCGYCRQLFKPNPKSVLNDTVLSRMVFCSEECWKNNVEAEAAMDDAMQDWKPEVDENGRVLI